MPDVSNTVELRGFPLEDIGAWLSASDAAEILSVVTDYAAAEVMKERQKWEAEVELLRADAARYQWLRKAAQWRPSLSPGCVTWDLEMPEPSTAPGTLTAMSVAESMDAAIDAEMARVESDSTQAP